MRMRATMIRFAMAALLGLCLGTAVVAAEGEGQETPHYPLEHPHYVDWTFGGPFGKYDPQQLQRGFHVYRDVCANCHAMSMVAFRHLASESGPKFTEDEVKALAAEYQITDGPDASGEMFQRPGRPSDHLPGPFANEQAARASNSGAYPPDLSLIAKARGVTRGFPTFLFDVFTQYQELGPDYIHALLTGYQDAPAGVEVAQGQYYNPYFISGASLAMPPPLTDGQITYAQNQDETDVNNVPETVDQYAKDVSAFLMWAAEPHLVDRKAMGLTVIVFLILLSGLVYYTKKKVWTELH
jgi:ubiquinol-cytochrome c reductase cytochrome c1 subunit